MVLSRTPPETRHDRAQVIIAADKLSLRHALKLAIGRRRGRLSRPPAIHPPKRVEAAYYLALSKALAVLRGLVKTDLLPKIPHLVESAPKEIRTHDSVEARHDVFSSKIEDAVHPLRVRYINLVRGPVQLASLQAATSTNAANKKAQQNAMETVFGVRPELAEPWLTPMIDSFVSANAKLVSNVGTEFLDSLEQRIGAGVRQGLRAEDIAAGIAQDFVAREGAPAAKAQRRAALIARDQVGSFFGDLSRVRQTEMGVERYVWRTSNDERVRKSHRERDGVTFEWTKPIQEQLADKGLDVDDIDGPPGVPIRCRCISEPKFDDLLEDLPPIEPATGAPPTQASPQSAEAQPTIAPLPEPEPEPEPLLHPSLVADVAPPQASISIDETTRAHAAKLLGRIVSDEDIAALTGMANGRVSVKERGGKLKLEAERSESNGDNVYMARTLHRDKDGRLVMHNDLFQIRDKNDKAAGGGGIGRDIFTRQVAQLRRLGVDRIETLAASGDDFDGNRYNGYYTWARFGYDGDVPTEIANRYGFKRIRQFMETEERRAQWKEEGNDDSPRASFQGVFDLADGSYSMTTLDAYLREKKKR